MGYTLNPFTGQFDNKGSAGGSGSGTVTSVGLSAPSVFTVTNSPVVGSGVLTFAFNNQSGNVILASPADGSSGQPAFRNIVAADIPSIPLSGTTGTLPINRGGTGQITAPLAFNALSPVTTTGDLIYSSSGTTNSRLPIGSTNQVLTVVGGVPAWATASAGSGTVTSVSVVSANGFAGTVATSTSTPAITISTSITGLLKGNGAAISAAVSGTDYVIPSGSITGTSSNVTGIVLTANGGTGLSNPGTSGNVLTSNGTIWVSSAPAAMTQNYNFQRVTLNSGQVTAKAVTLTFAPTVPSNTRLTVIGGPEQNFSTDYTVSGSTLSWSGLALDGVLAVNDILNITFN